MRNVSVIILFFLLNCNAYGQRIVANVMVWDIDDCYNELDSAMAKNKVVMISAKECRMVNNKISCIISVQKKLDSSGRLIELLRGENISKGKYDYIITYKKITDSLYEVIARYPAGSKKIPVVDSMIKGQLKSICPFQVDKTRHVYVRSLYTLDGDGRLKDIRRYDFQGNLIEISYPYGNLQAKKQWSNVSVNEFDSTVAWHWLYEAHEQTTVYSYNKKGQLVESQDISQEINFGRKSMSRKFVVYDSEGRLATITQVGENNDFVSEERFYYNKDGLYKYTEDDNLSDSLFREEKHFNSKGQVSFCRSYNRHSGSVMCYYYSYYVSGLLEKEEYFLDNKKLSTVTYTYHKDIEPTASPE